MKIKKLLAPGVLLATLIGAPLIAYDVYQTKTAYEYLPSKIGVESIIYKPGFEYFYLYKLTPEAAAAMKRVGLPYFQGLGSPRGRVRNGSLSYLDWEKTPVFVEKAGSRALKPSIASSMRGTYSESLSAYSAFVSKRGLKGGALTAFNTLKNAIETDDAYFTFDSRSEVFVVVYPDAGLAAVSVGEN